MIHAHILKAIAFARRVPVGVWAILGAILALWALWAWHSASVNSAASQGRVEGAQEQREADLRAVIEQVERANDAREDNRNRTDDERRADCLRRSRTPQNC